MESILSLLTAFGLSSSAGLNAYIPLLITGLVARYTELLTLEGPFSALENPWVLGTIGVLLLIELLVDKIPAVDSLNDVIHSVIRPAAGAILFAANTGTVTAVDPALAVVLGLLAAGSIHATKSVARPAVTASTGGVGNPIVSTAEDMLAVVGSLLAIFLPIVMGIILAVLALVIGRWWWRRRNRSLSRHPVL